MRLDKMLSHMGTASRTEITKAAKSGFITVNGEIIRDVSKHIDPNLSVVTYCGEIIEYREFTYIMLNKPNGYVSATDDPREKTVLELLPPKFKRMELFPCGRLDKDTLGLLILTNDGDTAHRLLSPKHHADKVYKFRTRDAVGNTDMLENGITLDDGYKTLPAKIELTDVNEGFITLNEGKYHQVKRMFEAAGTRITYLERVSFGGITLDKKLKRGEWRLLGSEEIAVLVSNE